METPILHPEDQAYLAGKLLLYRPGSQPGYPLVDKGSLCPGSRGECESESDPQNKYQLVLIPELFEFSACLRYLGLDAATAQKVWSKWEQSSPERKNHNSAQYDAIAHIVSTDGDKDTDSRDDGPWHELLTRIGVNDDFRENVMDPRYKDIRMLRSCKYWAKYFFKHRCDTLVEMYKFSRERCERSCHIMEAIGQGPKTSVWSLE